MPAGYARAVDGLRREMNRRYNTHRDGRLRGDTHGITMFVTPLLNRYNRCRPHSSGHTAAYPLSPKALTRVGFSVGARFIAAPAFGVKPILIMSIPSPMRERWAAA